MPASTRGGQRRGSHGNPTHPNGSVWRPCSDCCSPNSILSFLLEEPPWIRAHGRGVQFPVSHLCSNQSPLTPWGAGSRKSPAQDTQIHGCSRLSQTVLHTHRAPQAQSPRTSSPLFNSSSSSQADDPKCPQPPQFNKRPLFIFTTLHSMWHRSSQTRD